MLVSDHDKAPLKAVDFGLAVTFQSASEPRSDLGLEGTPWYAALIHKITLITTQVLACCILQAS
jgi:hypothetical protein